MALFCASFSKDAVYLLRFPLRSPVKVIACTISFACRLSVHTVVFIPIAVLLFSPKLFLSILLLQVAIVSLSLVLEPILW